MFKQIQDLFQRYVTQHLSLRCPGFNLCDESGRQMGYLDRIEFGQNRLTVMGWARVDRVTLVVGTESIDTRPSLTRLDTVRSDTDHPDVGFHLELPCKTLDCQVSLCLATDQVRHVFVVPPSWERQFPARRFRLLLPFAGALLRASPAILRWRFGRDLRARTRVKSLLGLSELPVGVVQPPRAMFRDAEVPLPDQRTAITLILPVYNAFSLLPEALDRIVRHTDLPWHLILIEDCSTDPQVRPFLRDWVAAREAEDPGRITLIENPENHGFIQSVNSGFKIARTRGDHVVLINSDAFVPRDWASRLLYPMLTQPRVGSVTPMSNDAEILSVPALCQKSDLAPGLADQVDAAAAQLNPETAIADLPTGVGFCMAIHIDYLRQVPELDPAFGRGYGEEVDWCQKVRARGGRHLGTAALFVEHRGGASFGSAEKRALVAANDAIISRRYPGYDAEVQDFIRADPLAPQRLALALALEAARQDAPMPIYLAHSLGGGAEKYLEHTIRKMRAAVVLRVGGAWRWQLELHRSGAVHTVATGDFAEIEAMLAVIPRRRIIYSCGVGAPNPIELPARLLSLKRGEEDSIEVLFHDFFPLSPSYTLLNRAGVFAGVPSDDDTDPAHRPRGPGESSLSLADWRAAWGQLIEAAESVVVFSHDSRAHVLAAYPQAAPALNVRPHQLLVPVPRVKAGPRDRRVIGVLGNIGQQKGAAVVVDLARRLEQDDGGRLVLIGNLDPNYRLPASAELHGTYRIEDIPRLVARYGITDWLIPSIWPETFSFTTHEALATGLPVWCFDLGAQAEAVRAAPNGHVIPLTAGGDPGQVVLAQMTETARETS